MARSTDPARLVVKLGYPILALLPLFLLFFIALSVPPSATNDVFADDAFYYFRVARNLAHGAGSTFGGLVPTNGYHPLWQFMLVPVFWLAGDGHAALDVVVALSSISWICLVVMLRALGRGCNSEAAFLVGVLYAFYCCTNALLGSAGLLFNGMETILVLPLLAATALVCCRCDFLTYSPCSRRQLLGIGALLALLLLARLDTAFVACVLIAARLILRRGHMSRDAIWLVGPPISVLAVYCAINGFIFHTLLPVSGTAKALGAPYANFGAMRALILGTYNGYLKSVPLGLAFVALPTVLALLRRDRAETSAADRARQQVRRFLAVMIAGQLLHAIYLCVGSSWQIWSWYGYERVMIGTLACALAASFVAPALPDRITRNALAIAGPTVAVLLVIGGVTVIMKRVAQGANDGSYWMRAEANARDLDRILPANSVIAMGDLAGSLAFWLPRPFVQTEGLLETRAYLDTLGKPAAWQAYFKARGVTHIAAADFHTKPCSVGAADCRLLVEPKFGRGPKVVMVVRKADVVFEDRTLTVWRYQPDIQTSMMAP